MLFYLLPSLSKIFGASHRLNHLPKNKHGLDLGPLQVADEELGLPAGPPTKWSTDCSGICCLPVDPIPLTGPPFLNSVGEDAFTSAVT